MRLLEGNSQRMLEIVQELEAKWSKSAAFLPGTVAVLP